MIRSLTDSHAQAAATPAGPVAALTLEALARLDAGTPALIEGIDAEGTLRRRLLEAGFTAGCAVRFLMATPFGDPLVFSLRGASIALRKSEARCVRVRFRTAP
jgi:ferrous iron transport protein A